jgi:ribosomal protein S18 acetylase RimI-like enzyme
MQLYESTRSAELESVGWDAAQTREFIRMQFNAQTRGYAVSYPEAGNQIVTLNEQPVGRILVNRDKRAFVLVDIALVPQHRNRGIGTFLLQELLNEAAGVAKPVQLHVLRDSSAVRLYERLGFCRIGEDAIYLEMRWTP